MARTTDSSNRFWQSLWVRASEVLLYMFVWRIWIWQKIYFPYIHSTFSYLFIYYSHQACHNWLCIVCLCIAHYPLLIFPFLVLNRCNVKVLLFVSTSFHNFYKIHWSVDSWYCGLKNWRLQFYGKIVFLWILIFVVLVNDEIHEYLILYE